MTVDSTPDPRYIKRLMESLDQTIEEYWALMEDDDEEIERARDQIIRLSRDLLEAGYRVD
jgi:hypothetical protein